MSFAIYPPTWISLPARSLSNLVTLAKFHSDYPEAFANPDDPTTRGEHFFAEAVDLLKKEEGRIPLTTFQAWGDMYAR
jgi:hypothetical protein